MKFSNSGKGFTLIELLVVISIIGVLSSVVLASLKTARDKSRDAAIKSQMIQFRNLLIFEYDTNGTYAALQPGWVIDPITGDNCDVKYPLASANPNVVKANPICKALYTASTNDPSQSATGFATSRFHAGISGAFSANNVFSIMVFLPSAQVWHCMGSSGQSQTAFGQPVVSGQSWSSPGCFGQP